MIEQWECLVEDLCRQHKDIAHEAMEGNKKRRCFFPFKDEESPVANSNAASPYVAHQNFYAAGTKQTQWIYTSELAILVNVDNNTKSFPDAVKKAKTLSFAIAQQFDAKLIELFDEGDSCSFFEDLLESTLTPMGMVDQCAYGWLLTVKFVKDRPGVDPAKWN